MEALLREGRDRPRPSLRRPDPRRPHGHARLPPPRHRRPPRSRRPQTPRHLRRNRPLRHRRHRRSHRHPPRQTSPQIPRLGQDGRQLSRFRPRRQPRTQPRGHPRRPRHPRRRARIFEATRPRALPPTSSPKMLSRCSPTARCPTKTSSPPNGSRSRSTRARCQATRAPASPATRCGEGINYDREVIVRGGDSDLIEDTTLCQGCAHPEARYYQPL